MDFQTAVRTCLSKYVTFSGRAQRSEFWYFALFSFLGSIVFTILDGVVFGVQALSILWSLAMILPSVSAAVRRLHDLDRSGWWYWVILVPLLGVLLLLYWFVQPGTNGRNEFGDDPLDGQGLASA